MPTKCKLTTTMTNINMHTHITGVHICVKFELVTIEIVACSTVYRSMRYKLNIHC